MSFCVLCFLRKLRPSQHMHQERERIPSSDLTKELDDLRKFSMSSLMILLAVLAIGGSKHMLPVVLALLVYSISLRLTVNACFLQDHAAFSKFLHAVPLLATFCMACVELVLRMRSSALAVVILLLCASPFAIAIIHHGTRCDHDETPLPVRVSDLALIVSTSSGTVVGSA